MKLITNSLDIKKATQWSLSAPAPKSSPLANVSQARCLPVSHAWYTVYQRHVTPILQVFQSDLGGVLCLNLTSKPCLPDRNTCKKRSPTSNAEKQAVISVKVFSKIIAHFWISGSEISKRTRQKGKDCNMYLKTTSTALPVTGVMTMKMN